MRITIEIDVETKEIVLKHNRSMDADKQNTAEMFLFILYEFPEIFGIFWGNLAKAAGLNESSMKDYANRFLMGAFQGFKLAY